MSSNCDSDGCPIDHDGFKLEDGVFSSAAPFAIRGDVFRDIMSGSSKDTKGSHLEVDALDLGNRPLFQSSSGGIPLVEQVEVEEDDSDGTISPSTARAMCGSDLSATVQAVLRSSKHEREELYAARNRLMKFQSFIKSKGFSEADVLGSESGEYFSKTLERDEFGLPKLVASPTPSIGARKEQGNPMVDKMKSKLVPPGADNLFEEMPKSSPPPSVGETRQTSTEPKVGPEPPKSWSHVVKTASPVPPQVKFSYVPPKEGENIVAPPDDELKEGNDKLKFTIVGSFTKGTVSFNKMVEFANKAWKDRGLLHVGQKDSRTYLFRFNSESSMANILVRGTWYIDRKPMVVHAWGTAVSSIKTMPLWVRFDQVPDSYWTQQCLSRLASVIGPPLCADELTAKLEVLPFAKISVQYSIGDTLPTSIPVMVLNPITNEKTEHKVLVSYPSKPLACSACKSLGHLVGACPTVTRVWVKKVKSSETEAPVVPETVPRHDAEGPSLKTPVEATPSKIVKTPTGNTPLVKVSPSADMDLSDASATPSNAFKNLRKVDECDNKHTTSTGDNEQPFQLSKHQKKRLRKAQGKSPPPST